MGKEKFEGPHEVVKVENNNAVIWKLGKQITVNVDQVRIYPQKEKDEGVGEFEGSDTIRCRTTQSEGSGNSSPRVAQSEGLNNNRSEATQLETEGNICSAKERNNMVKENGGRNERESKVRLNHPQNWVSPGIKGLRKELT
ncbi:hypothetical protein TNCV_4624551 [Trichonephila clavipes]|nr:hypothetical protein TNCV_4624551 [Trichonephila clavipes]